MADFQEVAILAHLPEYRAIDPRSGVWYYSFLLDVAQRLGFSGSVVTDFSSTAVFIEAVKKKGIGLVSLDNRVVQEVTFKDREISKRLNIGRHIFLLHGWDEARASFLYSDVFNPFSDSVSALNLWVPLKTLDSYLVTERDPHFSTRGMVLTWSRDSGSEVQISHPLLGLKPELSPSEFLIWLRTHQEDYLRSEMLEKIGSLGDYNVLNRVRVSGSLR